MTTTQQLVDALRPRYEPQIRFLIEGGKLREEDGWGNVVAHCLIQAMAMEVLTELLDFESPYAERMAEVAAAHDGLKRLDRRPEDFTEEEIARAKELEKRALWSPWQRNWQMKALDPRFHLLVKENGDSFSQRLQFYVDDIASPDGDKLIPFDERIDEVSARNPDPEPEVEAELGRPYWEAERELGHKVERELWEMLKAKGIMIDKPADIPEFLNRQIEERFQVAVVNQEQEAAH